MSKYKSFFLLPENTIKYLSDDGWDFDSKKCISLEIYNLLKNNLNGKEMKIAQDDLCFETEGAEFNFIMCGDGVQEIYIKVYQLGKLLDILSVIYEVKEIINFEIFDPNKVLI